MPDKQHRHHRQNLVSLLVVLHQILFHLKIIEKVFFKQEQRKKSINNKTKNGRKVAFRKPKCAKKIYTCHSRVNQVVLCLNNSNPYYCNNYYFFVLLLLKRLHTFALLQDKDNNIHFTKWEGMKNKYWMLFLIALRIIPNTLFILIIYGVLWFINFCFFHN